MVKLTNKVEYDIIKIDRGMRIMFKILKIGHKNTFIKLIRSMSWLYGRAQKCLIKGSSLKGFTLIELMFSVLIIVIVSTATFYGSVTIANTRVHAHRMSVASFLAQDKLEEFKATAYADIDSGSDNKDVYVRTWSYSESDKLMTITVTVTFPSSSGTLNSVTLTTMKADI